jgi:hypothetical protein
MQSSTVTRAIACPSAIGIHVIRTPDTGNGRGIQVFPRLPLSAMVCTTKSSRDNRAKSLG